MDALAVLAIAALLVWAATPVHHIPFYAPPAHSHNRRTDGYPGSKSR